MTDIEILNALLDKLHNDKIWFTTKNDPTFEEASSYYKLDEYGDLTEVAINKIIKEIKNLLGDGAIDEQDAINLWIQEALMKYQLDYIENLITKFKPKQIVDQIDAYEVNLNESKSLKKENIKTKIEEENTKSLNLISSMFTDPDFDAETPQGKLIIKTSDLFNELSEKNYDVQVTFDNGESQSNILLNNNGGKIIITINDANQDVKAYTSGSFELNDDNINILNDIKDIIKNI